MDRLISADALKQYIDAQKGRPFIGCTVGEAFKIMTDEQPTVDAVPVIRCGECGHFKKLHIDRGLCLQTEGCVRIHDFCSWAERKDNGQTD